LCIPPNVVLALLVESLAVKTGRVSKKKASSTPKIEPEPLIDEDDMLSDTGDEATGEVNEFI
jgi:hypothetical protein